MYRYNYQTLLNILDKGHNVITRDHRNLGSGCKLTREDGYLSITYYQTEIVQMYPGDKAKIFRKGWATVSTHSRITWLTRANFKKGDVIINEKTPMRWIKCRQCGGLEWTPENQAIMALILTGVERSYNRKRWSSDYDIKHWIQLGCITCSITNYDWTAKTHSLPPTPRNLEHPLQVSIGGVSKTTPFVEGMWIDCTTGYPIEKEN